MYIGKKSMSPPRPPVDPDGRFLRTSASGKKENAAGERAGTADQVAGTLEAVQSVPVTAAEALPSRESVAVMAERSGGNLRSEGTANAEGSRSSDPSARMDDLTEDLTNTPRRKQHGSRAQRPAAGNGVRAGATLHAAV